MAKTTRLKTLFEGRLRLETQNDNPTIYARTYLQGKWRCHRTKTTFLHEAEKTATDWYLSLLHKTRTGERLDAFMFADIAKRFIAHADSIGEPSALQRRNYRHKASVLKQYFEGVRINEIDADWLDRFKAKRTTDADIAPSTLKKDFVFIRLVMQFGVERVKCIETIPQFPSFTGDKWSLTTEGRPEFSAKQYKTLIRTAWKRTKEPDLNPRVKRQREELYAMIHVMMGAALRVGEAQSIRWRDARLDTIDADGLFHFTVKGKHSKGGKREDASMKRAGYLALRRLFAARDKTTTLDSFVFTSHRDGFRELLDACSLRFDKKTAKTRDMKSLRPSSITAALNRQHPNPNYRDTALWARTSPTMIMAWYDRLHPHEASRRVLMGKRNT